MIEHEAEIRAIVARVLVREGGVKDVGDGKGVTRYGQTDDWLKEYKLATPTSPLEAAANYRTWILMTGLDAVCSAADVLPDVVIDFAVHSHAHVAVKALQRALRTTADGDLGPATRALIDHCNRPYVAHLVLAERMELLGQIITKHPDPNATYAHGWMNRLAGQIRDLGRCV